ncbi:hypothetical protein ASG73_06705 [Janibacter sp. Soil728]|uniref:hypothetical protein n=1 Tax=Janibacter sp. Soil728 TaxID=1736393 RepID=UPI0006FD181C|nr:hypothetical protein [Janibacter sp. Soil728]KRE38604.1 hypothetical protein ASG73_06705 [Janibacter sp. Soil728]
MGLHCPAILLVAASPRDPKGADALVAALAGERVLSVVRAPGDEAGGRLAQTLDVPLEDEPGLTQAPPPRAVLGEIADLHRGETVLVLTSERAGDTPFARMELD